MAVKIKAINPIEDEDIDEEISEEENKSQTRMCEDDILGGLMAAASYKDSDEETIPIEIIRNKKPVLKFDIRPLSDSEYNAARTHNSKYTKNKNIGIKITESVDDIRYRSELIYMATVPVHGKKIWDNKAAWDKFDVPSGIDLIDFVLKAGEKSEILKLIDQISGYGVSLEETAKN